MKDKVPILLFIVLLIFVVFLLFLYLYNEQKFYSYSVVTSSQNSQPTLNQQNNKQGVAASSRPLKYKKIYISNPKSKIEVNEEIVDKLIEELSAEVKNSGQQIYENYEKNGMYVRFEIVREFPQVSLLKYRDNPESEVVFAIDRNGVVNEQNFELQSVIYFLPGIHQNNEDTQRMYFSKSIIFLLLRHFETNSAEIKLDYEKYLLNSQYQDLVSFVRLVQD